MFVGTLYKEEPSLYEISIQKHGKLVELFPTIEYGNVV
jgi:hypothetical protein